MLNSYNQLIQEQHVTEVRLSSCTVMSIIIILKQSVHMSIYYHIVDKRSIIDATSCTAVRNKYVNNIPMSLLHIFKLML